MSDDIIDRAGRMNKEAKDIIDLLLDNNPRANRVKSCPKCKALNHSSRLYCFNCRGQLESGDKGGTAATSHLFQ